MKEQAVWEARRESFVAGWMAAAEEMGEVPDEVDRELAVVRWVQLEKEAEARER